MSLIDAIIVSQTVITAQMHFETPIFMKPPQHLYCLISGLDYDCSPNNFQLRYAQFKRGKTLQAIRDTVLIFKLKKKRKTFFFTLNVFLLKIDRYVL
jgi:fucose permease